MRTRSLRSLLPCIALVLFTLGPLAAQLRTQNPWNCFQLTLDESYFVQAFVNWDKGQGYKAHEHIKPLDPGISAGLPMAWGTQLIRKTFHMDWPQAGRLWVYLNYHLILLALVWISVRRSKSWHGAWFALASMGLYMNLVPSGGYLIYGILGEVPGGLIAICALLCLQRFPAIAGALAIGAFIIKPTYAMLVPAASLAALVFHGKRGLRTVLASAFAGLAWLLWVSKQRGETLAEYLAVFRYVANAISLQNESARFWDYYLGAPPLIALTGVAFLYFMIQGLRSRWGARRLGFGERPLLPEELGAWAAVAVSAVWFLIQQRRPLAKHWFAMTLPAAFFLCVRLSVWAAPWINRKVPEDLLKPVLVTAVLTWLINVPSMQRQKFIKGPEVGCAVKEQRAVDRYLVEANRSEPVTSENLAGIVGVPSIWFVYELGINPKYYLDLNEASRPLPKWIVGETSKLVPPPQGCEFGWKGDSFSALKCGK